MPAVLPLRIDLGRRRGERPTAGVGVHRSGHGTHENGALVIDETGDRKDGTKTAHVGRQYLGSIGKTDNGIVAVSSLWADEHVSYPLHVAPYTPAARLPKGKADPAFRTKKLSEKGPMLMVSFTLCSKHVELMQRTYRMRSGDPWTRTSPSPNQVGVPPSTPAARFSTRSFT